MSARHRLSVAAFVALGVGLLLSRFGTPPSRVVFLAVGQGDCSLIQSEGRTVMIDTGPESAGQYVLPAKLRRYGVNRIDLLLLTHPDADHIAALPALARRAEIVRIGVPSYFKGHPSLDVVLRAARVDRSKLSWIAGPAEARVGEFSLRLDVPRWTPDLPDNDGSLFVRVEGPGISATFTGDAGIMEEIEMMGKGSWSATVLKLGHHGSRFSSGDSWLDHVHPSLAIVSCGPDNSYGHPAPEALERCAARRIQVRRTDHEGDIVIALPERDVR